MRSIPMLAGLALVAALTVNEAGLAQQADAEGHVWRHAQSFLGTPKYPEGFERFDYVNPDAPQGGTIRLGDMGGFDSFNIIIPQGEPASGLGLVYETLTTSSMDEVLTDYGLLAEAVTYPEDYSWATFRMNPDARWHDGEPVSAEDVVWSFTRLKELNPNYAQYYANVTGAEVTAPGEVTFTFDETGNRELPKILGQLIVLPQHWWEGTDADGNQRDISQPTLEPPLGSGPYRVEGFTAGRNVTYVREPDYWGNDHPTRVGHFNFERVRYEYFSDLTIQFEAFKADQIDWWSENVARRWATAYDIPAVNEGRIVRELFPQPYLSSGIGIGFMPNLRQERFQTPKLREAMNYAFDFEELNRTIFYGQYERVDSYFYGLDDLRWQGLPEGLELEILESVRDLVPESVFTTEYVNPVGGDTQSLRANLRTALRLLQEAGYTLDGNRLVDESGQQLSFEILLNGPTLEPVASAFQSNLQSIGMDVSIRTVDSSQYVNRLRSFDYDMIYSGWSQSLSPGNEQRFYFGSVSANDEGSSNYMGIADPGIDALIDRVIFAPDRETLEAATRALDRVLMAHHFMVPSYALRNSRIARWDRFGHPEPLPEFAIGFPSIWWWDAEKAARTGGAGAGGG